MRATAQDAAAVTPNVVKVKLENDRVRPSAGGRGGNGRRSIKPCCRRRL